MLSFFSLSSFRRPVRFSLPAQLKGGSKSFWLAGSKTEVTGSETKMTGSEWLAGGSRVPPLPHQLTGEKEISLAESVRAGLLRVGASWGGSKSGDAAQAETDLADKLRSSLHTFTEKGNNDWIVADSDDEVSIVTLNTDTTDTTEDFDDFSDLRSDLDCWLSK